MSVQSRTRPAQARRASGVPAAASVGVSFLAGATVAYLILTGVW